MTQSARIAGAVIGFLFMVWLLGQLAPSPVNQAQPLSVIPAGAQPCGVYGSPASVRLIDTAGYSMYRITCGDGVIVQFSK